MTQNEKILHHLETYGSITPLEALEEYGIMRLASRISDLKKEGAPITSQQASRRARTGGARQFATPCIY